MPARTELAQLAPLQFGFRDIAISTFAAQGSTDGVAHLLAINSSGLLSCTGCAAPAANGPTGPFVPALGGGGQVSARRCAVAVEGPSTQRLSHVCVIAPDTGYVKHQVRRYDGTWSDLQNVPGPPGAIGMLATDVAVATCYDEEFTLVAVVDINQQVQVTLRQDTGQWTT